MCFVPFVVGIFITTKFSKFTKQFQALKDCFVIDLISSCASCPLWLKIYITTKLSKSTEQFQALKDCFVIDLKSSCASCSLW